MFSSVATDFGSWTHAVFINRILLKYYYVSSPFKFESNFKKHLYLFFSAASEKQMKNPRTQ